MKFAHFSVGLLALFSPLAAAWSKEDREIFRIRDEIAKYEPDSSATFYNILGIPPSASLDDVTKAYRKMTRSLHPDKVKQHMRTQAGKDKKSGLNVKPPTPAEIKTAVKKAGEAQARLSLMANILRGPERDRYDHFLSNGFPLWKGTDYYYNRYRPGLGTVIVGLFLVVGGGFHYLTLYMSWKRQQEFVQRYIKFARDTAWGGGLNMPGVEAAPPPPPPPPAPASDDEEGPPMPTNRRERRMQQKATKRDGGRTTGGKKARKAQALSGSATPVAEGPTGARKRVVAENGKILVVDSLGDVYLEEEDQEGEVHEFLLDPNELLRPSIMDTAVFRAPVWLFNLSVGRFLPNKASDVEFDDAADEEDSDVPQRTPSTDSAGEDFELLDKSTDSLSKAKASGAQQGKANKRRGRKSRSADKPGPRAGPDDGFRNSPAQAQARDDAAGETVASDEARCGRVLSRTTKYESSWLRRISTPKNCRWDDKAPPALTMMHCLLFAMASTFTVANLYYNQPILNKIAADFGVTYEQSSQVATLMQAGYAAGLVFVLPLGDILERRPFIISLILATATLWIGLCVTDNFALFRALSFICGATTVTPQLMLPLVGDFAPPKRKASLLAIVVSGLMLGLLMARLLSGVVSNFTSWRNIYWFSCGAQYLLACVLFCFMPDYPSTNPDGLNYLRALWSIPYMMVTEPVLIQACLIAFTISTIFTSFWTTLTFLLASPPYEYSSLQIGLFSLTGLVTILSIPLIGRLIDRFAPLMSTISAQVLALIGTVVGTLIGTFTVAGPIVQAIGIDLGVQTAQVANRAAIFNINPRARNRVNTAYMTLAFAGQLTGTAVGNRLYASGGWKRSGACSIAFVGISILISLARGPRETGWVGWRGGWPLRRDAAPPAARENEETRREKSEGKV
ncbi:hypothetical protein FZEAL_4885 [Fusarium zealandicum]|uniref:Major facilitator superfamily (MFS) profile domain-containing protein n=1 Tax=Fusarium zealandicum TaxID=1053134 RepID=A0A8H4ULJ2_9HYPO|nr:hypothetical protein FZEAL_4885 [Fusarium zealandicum]